MVTVHSVHSNNASLFKNRSAGPVFEISRNKPGKRTDMLACPDICRATDIEPAGEMPAKADRIEGFSPYPIDMHRNDAFASFRTAKLAFLCKKDA